jgi:hypothetical protein
MHSLDGDHICFVSWCKRLLRLFLKRVALVVAAFCRRTLPTASTRQAGCATEMRHGIWKVRNELECDKRYCVYNAKTGKVSLRR